MKRIARLMSCITDFWRLAGTRGSEPKMAAAVSAVSDHGQITDQNSARLERSSFPLHAGQLPAPLLALERSQVHNMLVFEVTRCMTVP